LKKDLTRTAVEKERGLRRLQDDHAVTSQEIFNEIKKRETIIREENDRLARTIVNDEKRKTQTLMGDRFDSIERERRDAEEALQREREDVMRRARDIKEREFRGKLETVHQTAM
jgi:hypothetical protein